MANRTILASDFSNARQLKRDGGPAYGKTVTVFALKLREAAVKRQSKRRRHIVILVDNPRRLLALFRSERSRDRRADNGREIGSPQWVKSFVDD